jgi:hypothetical protein
VCLRVKTKHKFAESESKFVGRKVSILFEMSQTGTWPPQNVMSRVRSPANTIVMNPLISNGQTLNETSMDMDNYSNSRVAAQMTTTTMMCMDQGQIQHGGRSGTSDVQQHPHMHLQQHLMSSAATSQCFDSNGNGYQMQDTAAQTVPAQQHLFSKLHESLSLEPKYQPNLFLPQESNVSISSTLYLYLETLLQKVFQCSIFFLQLQFD